MSLRWYALCSLLVSGLAVAQPQGKLFSGRVIDMSYPYNAQTLYWPTEKGFEKTTGFEGRTDKGYYYSAYSVKTAEHGGTHLDAPVHFAENRQSTDEIPLEKLMGPAVVLDVSAAAGKNADYQVSVADLTDWEKTHGPLPAGVILLVRTGYGSRWPDREAYLGTSDTGPAAVPLLHFPGLSEELAGFLVQERSINAIGIDTASIDPGQSTHFEAHRILLGANIPAFENVANLDQLPMVGAHVIALPMKIEGGSGAPLRIVGIVPASEIPPP